MNLRFQNRVEAGRRLAARLQPYANHPDVIVLGLPRGGVPVALEVARSLRAPLDVFVVRKLGVPGQEELAMGAIASGGVRVLNDEVVRSLRIEPHIIDEVSILEEGELARRERLYRGHRPPVDLQGLTVILVDDGLATGATMRAAIAAVKLHRPAKLVVAVPVAAAETADELAAEVDDLVCILTPESLRAVGLWYEDFGQTTDAEVRAALTQASSQAGLGGS